MATMSARSSMSLRAPTLSAPRAARRVLVRASENNPNANSPEVVQAGRDWMKAQAGITAPMGYFDPAGFTSSPTFSVGEAKRFRESELTHGRVAMLAALGWVVQENFHPLFGGQIGGPAFAHFQKVESVWPQFWEVILLAIGITEAYRIGVSYNDPRMEDQIKANHQPGELGFDPLGLYPSNATEKYDIQSKELNNGRLAMIAVAGFAAQEERDHTTIFRGLFGGAGTVPPPALPPY